MNIDKITLKIEQTIRETAAKNHLNKTRAYNSINDPSNHYPYYGIDTERLELLKDYLVHMHPNDFCRMSLKDCSYSRNVCTCKKVLVFGNNFNEEICERISVTATKTKCKDDNLKLVAGCYDDHQIPNINCNDNTLEFAEEDNENVEESEEEDQGQEDEPESSGTYHEDSSFSYEDLGDLDINKYRLKDLASTKHLNKTALHKLLPTIFQNPDELASLRSSLSTMSEHAFCRVINLRDCIYTPKIKRCECTEVKIFGSDFSNGQVCEHGTLTVKNKGQCMNLNPNIIGACYDDPDVTNEVC